MNDAELVPMRNSSSDSEENACAKELLRSNGYWIIQYGKSRDRIKNIAADFGGACMKRVSRFQEWRQEKKEARDKKVALKQTQRAEEQARIAESEKRREAILAQELRLAELRVEEARLLAASNGVKDSERM